MVQMSALSIHMRITLLVSSYCIAFLFFSYFFMCITILTLLCLLLFLLSYFFMCIIFLTLLLFLCVLLFLLYYFSKLLFTGRNK
jgi:hypothetical protein